MRWSDALYYIALDYLRERGIHKTMPPLFKDEKARVIGIRSGEYYLLIHATTEEAWSALSGLPVEKLVEVFKEIETAKNTVIPGDVKIMRVKISDLLNESGRRT